MMLIPETPSKRVRFTHKEPDKRTNLEMTDDTVAKRAKLFDTSPSSCSSHEAPKLHDSSGKDPETRESVLTKSRVDAGMEISECHWMLTTAILEVDREAGHCTQDVTSPAGKYHTSLRQSPKPQNSTASETSESTLRCMRAKPTPRFSAAKVC